MQYVYFKTVKVTNFLSVGKKPVTINFRPGLNIITGKNYDKSDRANGVGKSTIADAVYFALYGSSIRDLKKENIVNNFFANDLCEVELEFCIEENDTKTEYKIVRTLNPTKCFLYINGEDKTRSGVPQTTEYITSIINTSPEVFQNSVVMTINNTVPFMAQKKVEKRKFIEGILGLEVFSNMLLIARQEFNDTKRLLDIEITKSDETDKTYKDSLKQKEAFEENRKKRLNTLLTRQNNNDNELAILNNKLSKFESVDEEAYSKIVKDVLLLKEATKTCNAKATTINKAIAEAEAHIKFNATRIKSLKKTNTTCPHCGKNIAESAEKQHDKDKHDCEQAIEKNKEVVEKESTRLKQVQEKIESLEQALTDLVTKQNNFSLIKKEHENTSTRIQQLVVWQNQLKSDIEQLNSENDTFSTTLKEIEERIKLLQDSIAKLQEKIDIIETAKFITSEEGVKSFIVKKILEVLNTRLAFYLKRLESNSVVKFNEFFEEIVTNERGVECSYFNFSGAERKAIDLAMLFTFQDMRRSQANVWLNLSIFDELLDSSLDEKGIELVLEILRERVEKYQEAVYVISHRKESMKYCTNGEIVYLEKKNGVTTRTNNYLTNDE